MNFDKAAHILTIEERWRGRFDLLWNYEAAQGQPRWRILFWDLPEADFYLTGRMMRGADAPLDYYVIPAWEVGRGSWRSSVSNGELDIYRHKSLASVATCLARGDVLRKARSEKQRLGADHPLGGRPRKLLAPAQ